MKIIEAEGKVMDLVSKHRGVVGYLGELNAGKYLYLLTQFVPNGDLRNIDFVPQEDDIWEIVMQMATVLKHLQKNNVVHRDIKPENILIKTEQFDQEQPDVVFKLADFGLA